MGTPLNDKNNKKLPIGGEVVNPIDKLFNKPFIPAQPDASNFPNNKPSNPNVGWREFVRQFIPDFMGDVVEKTPVHREIERKRKIELMNPYEPEHRFVTSKKEMEKVKQERYEKVERENVLPPGLSALHSSNPSIYEKIVPQKIKDLFHPSTITAESDVGDIARGAKSVGKLAVGDELDMLGNVGPAKAVFPFFSKVEKAIAGAQQAKMKGNEWLGVLKKFGVSREELKSTQFGMWLEQNATKTLAKDELIGTAKTFGSSIEPHIKINKEASPLNWTESMPGVNNASIGVDPRTGQEMQAVIMRREGTGNRPEIYDLYIHPKGKPIRIGEDLVSHNDYLEQAKSHVDAFRNRYAGEGLKHPYYNVFPGGEDRAEILTTIPNYGSNFQSVHWRDTPNVVSHALTDIRQAENAEKIYGIWEVQSDWAQMGRKKGFRTKFSELPDVNIPEDLRDKVAYKFRNPLTGEVTSYYDEASFLGARDEVLKRIDREINTAATNLEFDKVYDLRNLKDQVVDSFYLYYTNRYPLEYNGVEFEISVNPHDKDTILFASRGQGNWTMTTIEKLPDDIKSAYLKVMEHERPPDFPFKQTSDWVDLTLGSAINDAIDKGADRIALASPEMQTAMHGTQRIEWKPNLYTPQLSEEQIGKLIEKYGTKFDGFIRNISLTDRISNLKGLADTGDIASKIEKEVLELRSKLPKEKMGFKVRSSGSGDDFDLVSIVGTKEDLIKNLEDNMVFSEDELYEQADKIWKKMQAAETGISQPRKEAFEEFYGKLVPSRMREVLRKLGFKDTPFEKIKVPGPKARIIIYELTDPIEGDVLKFTSPYERRIETARITEKFEEQLKNKYKLNNTQVDDIEFLKEMVPDAYKERIEFEQKIKNSMKEKIEDRTKTIEVLTIKLTPEIKKAFKEKGVPLLGIGVVGAGTAAVQAQKKKEENKPNPISKLFH